MQLVVVTAVSAAVSAATIIFASMSIILFLSILCIVYSFLRSVGAQASKLGVQFTVYSLEK